MLKDINDTAEHAKQLIKLLEGVRCKVNLIPFNTSIQCAYESSVSDVIEQFSDMLCQAGINTTIRKTRGNDIKAACGQLDGELS